MEKKIPDITVDEIMTKIRDKIGRQSVSVIQPIENSIASSSLQPINWESVGSCISNVKSRSHVWTTKPQMDHYTGIIKTIAIVVGKVILYFGQVFTKHQEAYNIAVLQSLHAMTDGLHVIEGNLSALESRINQIHTGVINEIQNRIELLHDEFNAGIQKIDAELADQRKLQSMHHVTLDQKISAIDKQRENDKAENKVLHTLIDTQREKDNAENKAFHTLINTQREKDNAENKAFQTLINTQREKDNAENKDFHLSIDAKIKDLDAITTATSKQIRMIENIEEKFVSYVSENLNSLATVDARIAGAYQRIEQLQQYGSVIDELSSRTVTLMKLEAQIEERVKVIDKQMEHMTVIEQNVASNTARLDKKAQLWPRVDEIKQSLDTLLATVHGQESRLATFLAEAKKRLPKPLDEKQLAVFSEELEKMDNELYLAFEDKFRGTREEIIDRVRVYLPVIQKAEAGTEKYPVIDIGCGRGEWLRLLRTEHYIAYGVDLSETMVEQCKKEGLHAMHADALEFLHNVQDESIGAVTGFHIIEHLPFDVLRSMFREAYRVLKQGGVAIFETPNPENLIVGANTFYYDPTHLNPLPSLLVSFVAEQCGFSDVSVLNLHPFDSEAFFQENTEVANRLNHYLYGPRDYAIVGWKK